VECHVKINGSYKIKEMSLIFLYAALASRLKNDELVGILLRV
jgi:hypothetical protein